VPSCTPERRLPPAAARARRVACCAFLPWHRRVQLRRGVFLFSGRAPGSLRAPDFRQPTKFPFQETFFMHNFLVLKPYNLCTKILHIIFFPNNWSGNILQQTFVIHKTFTYNFFQSTFQKILHDIQLTCITFLENLSDDIF